MGRRSSSLVPEAVLAIVCVGVDLAKNGFAVDGVDEVGKAVRTLRHLNALRLVAPAKLGAHQCQETGLPPSRQ